MKNALMETCQKFGQGPPPCPAPPSFGQNPKEQQFFFPGTIPYYCYYPSILVAFLLNSAGLASSSSSSSSAGFCRLYSKTEHLEQLMGEEVTDINEILAVINNIQVQIQIQQHK